MYLFLEQKLGVFEPELKKFFKTLPFGDSLIKNFMATIRKELVDAVRNRTKVLTDYNVHNDSTKKI